MWLWHTGWHKSSLRCVAGQGWWAGICPLEWQWGSLRSCLWGAGETVWKVGTTRVLYTTGRVGSCWRRSFLLTRKQPAGSHSLPACKTESTGIETLSPFLQRCSCVLHLEGSTLHHLAQKKCSHGPVSISESKSKTSGFIKMRKLMTRWKIHLRNTIYEEKQL